MTANKEQSIFGTGIPENCTKEERLKYGTPGAGKAFEIRNKSAPIVTEELCKAFKRQAVFGFESQLDSITNYLVAGYKPMPEIGSIVWTIP